MYPENDLISKIREKPYHKISINDINPYQDSNLGGTVLIMGSPGAGKSEFLKRVEMETGGKLILESSVFDLFQEYFGKWLEQKRRDGETPDYIEEDFDMPNIDGFHPHINMLGFNDDPETVKNAPYVGRGAPIYREYLDSRKISSGGKSGFPDWLFITNENGEFYQFISIPGHLSTNEVKNNKSIPPIGTPDSVIYLIDPKIFSYNHDATFRYIDEKRVYSGGNPALQKCSNHLQDVLKFEEEGIPVNWFISKTNKTNVQSARNQIGLIYAGNSSSELGETALRQNLDEPLDALGEIVKRAQQLNGFDSKTSSKEEIYEILNLSLPDKAKLQLCRNC
ncbi:MAG: hypothetical protein ABIF85_00235 [Nanoarchaeota archaeon]|nr:AAA family ATPase [Nanoarchaeota archaeon]MBU4300203.1 AAA family ATPase [Nanoarchaeota archaeon]MBU4452077.1 AAA family ATPase [Nanoarchaeota archaeon]MCG2724458.1 AAA family ATPase [archaeon]